MESSKIVDMNERLNKLRFSLGIDWGELAKRLMISRSMLGFVRVGTKKPSPKLLCRISSLEKESGSHSVATCQNCGMLLQRVVELEKQLVEADKMLDERSAAVLRLIAAFDAFRMQYSGLKKEAK